MLPVNDELNSLFQPVVEGLGFVYWGTMLGQTESGQTLRIYIEHEKGIDVDDCAAVSRQISALLDVEDPISGAYYLEVSSPGMDRPLFKLEHMLQVVGEDIRVRTRQAVLGRRNFKGKLESIEGERLSLLVDNESYEVAMADIEKASLVPNYN